MHFFRGYWAIKAYKLYNPVIKKIVISRDVVFNEENTCPWTVAISRQLISINFDDENKESHPSLPSGESRPSSYELSLISHSSHIPGNSLEGEQSEISQPSRPQHIKSKPAWMQDYEVIRVNRVDDTIACFALYSHCDPVTFEDAIQDPKWQHTMDEEIHAIEKNNTWELIDLS